MPFTEKRLAGPTQLTTSAVAIYTVPANRTTIVKQLVATNTSASAATFTLYIGTATAANAVFNATSVAANDSLVINLSQVLTTGEVLRALASANTAINLTISGVENDGPLTPTATYIADSAITTAKLADSSVTATKFASNVVIPPSLVDAKGDLLVGTANDTVGRLAVGSNNQIVVADSATASGLRWADTFQRQSGASSGEASTINISPRPWNLAWGMVSNTVDASTQVNFASETTMLTTASFTAVASRRYKVTYCEPSISLVSGTVNGVAAIIRLTNISGSVLYVRDFTAANIASTNVSLFLSFTTTFSAGATVLNASTGTAGGGTARGARTATRSAYLLVEDIGPA